MPPLSGRIAWARQLIHHLEQPMQILKLYHAIIKSFSSTKLLYKKYNKTMVVLTEYELVHHKAWLKLVETGHKNLQVEQLIVYNSAY